MSKITRRGFLKAGGTAAALAPVRISTALTHPQAGSRRDSGGKPKNVLFLMSDQHRPHALGIDGDLVARTPNLDALAGTAVRFDSAYCTDPLCVPSRASLLTGRFVHNHQAFNNGTPWPIEHRTMAHCFSSAGYMTGMIGKMHFVDAQTHGFDYHLEFNDWFQYLGPKTKMYAEELVDPNGGCGLPQILGIWPDNRDPWTGFIERDNRLGSVPPGQVSALAEEDHFDSFVARESIRFLREHGKKQPFFLISSFLRPHDPFTPAERFARMYHVNEMNLPPTWGKVDLSTVPRFIRENINYPRTCPEVLDPAQAKVYIAMYYANLAEMDDNLGKVLRALHELELEEDTIVVYTADHGEMLGSHGLWQKSVFYEHSVGVPLMLRAPGSNGAKGRCKTPVSLAQLFPTLTDLCGLPTPPGLDGTSLRPYLTDPNRTVDATVYAELELKSPHAGYMIRRGDFKYCHYLNDTPELYDLSSDPDEMRNLAPLPQYKGKVEEMESALFAWHRPSPESQI